MDPIGPGHGAGVGRPVCVNGSRCMVGLGNEKRACERCPGLLGSAIIVGYRLVVGVFWHTPAGLGVCRRQPVDNGGVDCHSLIQVGQGRGSQPDDPPGRMAGVSLGMVFFPVVP